MRTALLATALAFGGISTTFAAHPVDPNLGFVDLAVQQNTDDFVFESFDAEYALERLPDGRSQLSVVEEIVAVFPSFDQNRGIIRAIPNDYDGVPLEVDVLSVADEHGYPIPFEDVSTDGAFTELRIGSGDYVHGRTHYTLIYTMENVVRAFPADNVDEFYWDVNGTGWAQPMHRVSAKVSVFDEAARALTGSSACYYGADGDDNACEIFELPGSNDADSESVVFEASVTGLDAHETLTVAIGFEFGTFVQVEPAPRPGTGGDSPDDQFGGYQPTPPTAAQQMWSSVGNIGGIVITVLGLIGTGFAAFLRFFKNKGAPGRGIIVPQYTPPRDTNLFEADELVRRQRAAIPAALINMAVKGNLRILDYPVSNRSGSKFTLQYLHGNGLDADEKHLVSAIFSGSPAVDVNESAQGGWFKDTTVQVGFSKSKSWSWTEPQEVETFPEPKPGDLAELGGHSPEAESAVNSIKRTVAKRLIDEGATRKRPVWPGMLIPIGLLVLLIAAFGLVFLSAFLGNFADEGFGWSFGAIFILVVCIILTFLFSVRPAEVTEAGADRRDYLLGLRDYLQLAEADRMRVLQSPEGAERMRAEGLDPESGASVVKLYEKLLPWAVLWGVEKEWAAELALRYENNNPDWFVSSDVFTVAVFSSAISGLGASVQSSVTAPSSDWSSSGGGSFSSGSSGGGSSGGGGGGGGGGGW